jgi:CDP-glycerol glycerophosphotransferase (TagB/SpsB family)
MNELLSSYPNSNTLKWDNEKDGLKAMAHADLMISDFSGIIYDYLFLFERPVLTFKSQFEKRGREAMDLKDISPDIKFLDKIGRTLQETDIPDLLSIIRKNLSEKNALPEVVKEAEQSLARHPGESGKRAADFIQSVLKSVRR